MSVRQQEERITTTKQQLAISFMTLLKCSLCATVMMETNGSNSSVPSNEKSLVSGYGVTCLDVLGESVLSILDPGPWRRGFPGMISIGWRNDTWWLRRWFGGQRTSSRSWCVLSLPRPCGWTGAAPVNAKRTCHFKIGLCSKT